MPGKAKYQYEPNLDQAVRLVMEMMAIPGTSCHEGKISACISKKLRQAGLPASAICSDRVHQRSAYGGEVGNLIVRLPGTSRGSRRLLMAHLDTVPICVGSQPVRRGNRIVSADPHTGLGADDRSGAAVVLTALLEILRQKLPHPPLTFFWSVQEEIGLIGVRHVSVRQLGNPKLAFNWDGKSSELTIGATGGYRIQIEIKGKAAHAGVHPERGVSAIAIASLAIARLQQQGWHGRIRKGRRSGASNVGVINAGQATNVVADQATLKAEVRSHDSKFRRKILDTYKKAFQDAARTVRDHQGRGGKIRFSASLDYESFRLKRSEPCVRAAHAALLTGGLKPAFEIIDGGLDANLMNRHGIPTVTLGAGQSTPHTVAEVLHLPQFKQACRVALCLATGTEK